MRILAIDPSLSATGICFDGRCSTFRSKQTGMERLNAITDWAVGDVDLVVIEECIVGRAVHVESMWLHGLLRHDTWIEGIPYVDIHPSRRMKFACGDQKERGKDAVLLRAERAGAKAENNDEADAWWMWHMAVVAYCVRPTEMEDLPLYRREVLAAIDWPEVDGYKPQIPMPKKPSKKKVGA